MDFLPLVIWAVGCLFVAVYGDAANMAHGKSAAEIKKSAEDAAVIWWVGSFVFLALGVLSYIKTT